MPTYMKILYYLIGYYPSTWEAEARRLSLVRSTFQKTKQKKRTYTNKEIMLFYIVMLFYKIYTHRFLVSAGL